MTAFVVFGMLRVAAPSSALGLLFDEPIGFAIAAAALSIGGAVLLFIRPFELKVADVLAGASREPSAEERARLERLLGEVGERAGVDPSGLIVRVTDDRGPNAAAGAGHLLFVTAGALDLPDDEVEGILAHELAHHRALHPVLTSVVWWLRLPGAALAAAYRFLRRMVGAIGGRFGILGRLLAVPILLLLVVWQVTVMWLFYAGELLAMRAARISEYEADGAAKRWGYAAPLIRAYEGLAAREGEPPGRLGRLLADHPPLESRIARLRS